MSSQLELTHDPGAVRSTDPDTSVEAALSIKATELESRVLDAIMRRADGATSHEISESLHMSLVTVSPRLRPLVRKGLIEDSGERRVGESGRRSIVWRAKP